MAEAQGQLRQLTKSEKAAIIFLYMDDQLTSEVFNQMEDDEIRKIANAMLNMNKIPAEQIQFVLDEFLNGYGKKDTRQADPELPIDGGKIAETMLTKNLPRGRSNQIMNALKNNEKKELPASAEANLKKVLEDQLADNLFEAIQNEHPQFIAIVLANCKKKTARELLEKFSEDSQPELLVRMASLTKVPGQKMTELQNYLIKKINDLKKSDGGGGATAKKKTLDIEIEGLTDTVKLLKSLKKDKSMKMVEEIEKIDADVGTSISKQMFMISDLGRANDTGIRELLRAISNEDLKVALKNSPQDVKDKFFGNMSQRAAMILKEDMEVLPTLKPEEIEVAEQNILKAAKELMKEEKLVLAENASEED